MDNICLESLTAEFLTPEVSLGQDYGPAGVSVKIAVGVGVLVGLSVGVAVNSGACMNGSSRAGVLSEEAGTRAERAELVMPRENASRLFPVRPQSLPSKNRAEVKLHAVVFPKETGTQIKTSSPAPAAPFTEKSVLVER